LKFVEDAQKVTIDFYGSSLEKLKKPLENEF